MPVKRLPTLEEFSDFKQKILDQGFREILKPEFTKTFERLGLVAPRYKEGREIGFSFSANNLHVIVWTTFLAVEQKAREQDLGWVLITEGDKAQYFAHPFRRTAGFLVKLLRYAWITKFRIVNRPLCPVCGKYMKISRGSNPKSRYWLCPKNDIHNSKESMTWDVGLGPKAQKFLDGERALRARYNKMLKKAGKPINQAMRKRKRWRVNKPQNVVS